MSGAPDSYLRIWRVVQKIPRGRVATYGQVAERAGMKGGSRLVGYALHYLPPYAEIPWQRVVNAQGRISLPKAGGHYARQKSLLEKEGLVFIRERIDLKKFGWKLPKPRSSRW